MQIRSPRSRSTTNRATARRSGAPRTRRRRPGARASPPRTAAGREDRATRHADCASPSPAIIPDGDQHDGHRREPRLHEACRCVADGQLIQQRGHQSQRDGSRAADGDPRAGPHAGHSSAQLFSPQWRCGRWLHRRSRESRPARPAARSERRSAACRRYSRSRSEQPSGRSIVSGSSSSTGRSVWSIVGNGRPSCSGRSRSPARPGRLDARRAPQEPIADVGDSKRLRA